LGIAEFARVAIDAGDTFHLDDEHLCDRQVDEDR